MGDGREHRLKVTKAEGMTSLLTPDQNQLRLFNPYSDWGTVVEEVEVHTHRLDDLDIDEFDLLKIDGAESDVIGISRHGPLLSVRPGRKRVARAPF